MNKIYFIFILFLIPLVSAEITIGGKSTGEVPNISPVNILVPSAPINYSTVNVNTSQFAEVWITSEGDMDNVVDLYTTLDTRYVEVAGDNMTGPLGIG